MSAEIFAKSIQLILAPVVMITACALLITGLLNRYGAVNDRLRLLARERFDLLRTERATPSEEAIATAFNSERMEEIDRQLPALLKRHKMIHDAALRIYTAAFIFIADMLVIALSVMTESSLVTISALIVFLGGMLALLWGVVQAVIELRTSHTEVHYEVERILNLKL